MAPDPKSDTFNAWLAAQDPAVVEAEITCTDPEDEQVARSLAKGKFNHVTNRTGVKEVQAIPPRQVALWNAMKAYAVDQVEPGRVTAVIAQRKETR